MRRVHTGFTVVNRLLSFNYLTGVGGVSIACLQAAIASMTNSIIMVVKSFFIFIVVPLSYCAFYLFLFKEIHLNKSSTNLKERIPPSLQTITLSLGRVVFHC